jgi:CheY-like chemotaxis protein
MTTSVPRELEPRLATVLLDLTPIRGKRILCVDDDVFVRRASGRLLDSAGATCLLAGTHEQSVAIAAGELHHSQAILDIHMPCGDVGDLVTQLRTTHASIPLIGTSGLDRRAEFAERGVPIFLGKPWKLDALLRAANW